eukprot:3939585-Rhodomonas_salina.1
MSDKAKAIYLFMSKFCESHSTIAKVLESLAMCDTMKSHFDKQPAHLLCCPNGVINLKEGKLIESSPDTEKWIRSCEFTEDHFCVTPFRRVDRMQTDAIRDFFLEHMFPHDVYPEADAILDAFQMFCGYRLTGETNVHQVWFMTGEGSNMKTQISRWLEETLGKHFVAILTAKNLDVKSSDNNDAIYTSRRKRMWNINESGTRNQWDDEMFK